MTLSTTINDSTVEATFHAAQHNEVNTDVLQFLAGAIGNSQVTLTGTPGVGNVPVATSATTAAWGNPPVGGTGLTPQATKTAAFTAVAGNRYPLDTSGGTFAVALPSTPTNGDQLALKWWNGIQAPTVTGTIDGVSGLTFGVAKQDVVLQWNASLSSWMAI